MFGAFVHCKISVRERGGGAAAFDQSALGGNRHYSPNQTPLRLRPPQPSQLPPIHRQPQKPLSCHAHSRRQTHRRLQRIRTLSRRRF